MARPIQDYALVGDCHTGAMVSLTGSIDWLCLPRFDSASTFGALLGDERHGHWRVAPVGADVATRRHYREGTFILETLWETPDGTVEVIDVMPHGDRRADVIRRVRGLSGTVRMEQTVRIRFDYAAALPWVRQVPEYADGYESAILAVAGPDAVTIRGPRLIARDHAHRGEFTVSEGQTVDIVLTWHPAHRRPPAALDVDAQIERTESWWTEWASHYTRTGEPYEDAVARSLLVLRALTHEDTGGIVAAATTSLPEDLGGVRNWDYRFVWLRDAAFTLEALLLHGYETEALEWRDWLLRAIAGDPADMQVMYGLGGERRLVEWTPSSLPGHRGSAPVRVGNAAYTQFQGDVYGEVMQALSLARSNGVTEDSFSWPLQQALLGRLTDTLDELDHGIWEIRGPLRRFTHSRVLMWSAFNCGVNAVEKFGLPGPVDEWRAHRDALRREIDEHGYNAELGTFVQYYGGTGVDAALLQLPHVGYLEADDPRMLGTVAAIEEQLMHDGLVLRYLTESGVDGLPGDEHPFLACSFWLVEQYALSGRIDDARELMDRLVGLRNDVGLLSEEVDSTTGDHMGNTPQAFSHLALVRAADAISAALPRH
ncbi:GH15 family glucan-1,4-alpha-glucosidase [Microbacteriaceae bacterium SG_E_30_P1]|uniref:GH15 family glucan-1,4-alpha-glucosidase n=1 Tax=Antiquaquibacter oligotrophicus TaxID=2880260 RepID=A0ABT6KM74_9MICO|nr:glycoside hydrolase family 15 protein [Antiquaquibacter oligotrophicus]MDH6180949.1 GH15 family glucan-1,4-alpha-glucosidase [Antiquaquibacter oligotrophicus]UDF13349.1 glycoside hydrolase family 15 protein [Antiquaquibacter oligotrophicus]